MDPQVLKSDSPEPKSKKGRKWWIIGGLFILLSIAAALIVIFMVVLPRNQSRSQNTEIAPPAASPITIDPNNRECQRETTLAKLEPEVNSILLGFHLDWEGNGDIPTTIIRKLGFTPAVFNAFLQLDPSRSPETAVRYAHFDWHAQEVAKVGGILSFTIEPIALAQVTEAHMLELARRCVKANSEYGVPMYLRWGHEMNGDWTNYGYQPTLYTESFRRVARMIHSMTNLTAMVWGPNLGINYPFSSPDGQVRLPLPGSPDFLLLDTNRDGVINNRDDPYGPYYPGDQYVDWVALSLYWFTDAGSGFNILPPPTFFRDMARSSGPGVDFVNGQANGDPLRDFYGRFSVERNKPMMIPETGASFNPSETGPATNSEIKAAWYRQIFSQQTRNELSKLKIVTQFEERKADGSGMIRDWRVANDSTTLTAFQTIVRSSNLVFANNITVTCGGIIRPRLL
jgi:hypothetical protein